MLAALCVGLQQTGGEGKEGAGNRRSWVGRWGAEGPGNTMVCSSQTMALPPFFPSTCSNMDVSAFLLFPTSCVLTRVCLLCNPLEDRQNKVSQLCLSLKHAVHGGLSKGRLRVTILWICSSDWGNQIFSRYPRCLVWKIWYWFALSSPACNRNPNTIIA